MTKFKYHALLWALIIFTLQSYGQTADTTRQSTPQEFAIIERAPEFPGGFERLSKILEDNFRYPKSAIADGVGGVVITEFAIDTAGNLMNIRILKGVREDIDQEAMRLVGLLNGWTPGTQGGKKVKVWYQMPITFHPDKKLQKRNKKKRKNINDGN